MSLPRFEIFLAAPPGLEPVLLDEVRDHGWTAAKAVPGGVEIKGSWPDIWRANLLLRGASRVLVRLGRFRADALNTLHGKSKELPWKEFLAPEQPFTVEATCRKSRIYHSGAAAERVAKAAAAVTGAEPSEDGLRIFVRIENNMVTISADSSGDLLHRRGFKEDVAKAPLRETLAALFLRSMGYRGETTVLDPMCGSGTIVLEAAEMAAGLAPGRGRRFAFQEFPSFNPQAFDRARTKALGGRADTSLRFHGSDRAEGAIKAAKANAERAGVSGLCRFEQRTVSEVTPPDSPPGLLLTNPPYGTRIGDRKALADLYRAFGAVVRDRFAGWRVGFVTSEDALAKATGLKLEAAPPVPHGSLKIRLWSTPRD
ncbi:THUMP domain-containing class I SAM-dependent RNA methyltransferase [Parvularcula lutaonensis]|uniref:Class I SAM-dependent RNA methyltransferase n=1 Tax=Parvularcula lutaonensis TaxID=491923 RepID=A0ABV7MCS9_9PROT|nr:class I SAM-dependent RNA methyltransferase [Parvularcula lutaonensis]GGY40789.1 RNA methyltransferase [Parvularcula lutaonensis]